MPQQVIVIGSGPAGLMAAITAAQAGRAVTILEALPSPGRKLLASGAGKCNFTNMLSAEDMAERFAPEQRRFVRPALLGFTPEDTRRFFAERGVKHKLVDEFYCFPASEKASDILQVLTDSLQHYGGKIICNAAVSDLQINDGFIKGVYCGKDFYACDYLIAAAGGPGYPRLGGGGSLDRVFTKHNIDMIERTPALCGIKSHEQWLRELTGIVLEDVILYQDKQYIANGTLLFTGDGISGPAALDSAGRIARLLKNGCPVTLKINFNANLSRDSWLKIISDARQNNGKRLLRNIFANTLPQALIAALVERAGAGNVTVAQLTGAMTDRLLEQFTACPLKVENVENWQKSMASTGGIARTALNSKTMQSRQIANLYAAGEFIDVDGPCGGYNIQWAFSSGRLAGMLKSSKK